MKIDAVNEALAGVYGIDQTLGEALFRHVLDTRSTQVLHAGWRSPKALCYLASALKELGRGRVIALDDGLSDRDVNKVQTALTTLALESYVEWRRSEGGRAWLLQELAQSARNRPTFDFVFVENARDLDRDGLTTTLALRWLRPGGHMAIHGLGWTYAKSKALKDTPAVRAMPKVLREAPQANLVLERLVLASGNVQVITKRDDWALVKKIETRPERWRRKYLGTPVAVQPLPAAPGPPKQVAVVESKATSEPLVQGPMQECPLCGHQAVEFLRHNRKGHPGRRNAKCPGCGSLERHRLIWLYFQRRTNLLQMPRKRLLHVAPEACLEKLFRESPAIDYLSGDLESPWHPAMVVMDITNIVDFKEGDFDVIYCSHVLEHVPEDQKAINELYRVLAPGGWAILQVPIVFQKTFQDPSIQSEADRERFYRHRLHVRAYGMDYKDQLEAAGFIVDAVPFYDQLSEEERRRYALKPQEAVFHCRKPER